MDKSLLKSDGVTSGTVPEYESKLDSYFSSKPHFEQTPLGVIEWNTNFRIIRWNPSSEKIFGYSADEAVGKFGPDLIVPPSDRQYVLENWSGLLNNKNSTRRTIRNLTKDKQIIYCDWYCTPLVDDNDKIIGVVSLIQDITERIKSEKIQKALYRISQAVHTIENIDDLYKEIHQIIKGLMKADNFYIALYDEKTDMISFPYYVDEFDAPPPPQKAGRGLTEYVLRTGKNLLIDAQQDIYLREKGETDLVGKPAEIWLGVTLKIGNKPIGLIVVQDYNDKTTYGEEEKQILTYVSEQIALSINRKQYEESIKKYSQELLELNAAKDKFFSIIAHDLRSPFNGLLGFTEMLVGSYGNLTEKEKKSYIEDIYQTTKQIYNLVENLLHWSRMQTGRMEFSPQRMNLHELIEEVFSTLCYSANLKSIRLINKLNPNTFIKADYDMLRSLFQNLISNGIKFTNKGGYVSVLQNEPDDLHVEITVKDNGTGIGEENLSRLFKPDENFTTKGTENEEGTGLGLLLCNEIVEKHGSKLKVQSKVNEGTSFSFVLDKA